MKADCPAQVWVYLACALFFLGLYKEAEEAASKGRFSSWAHKLIKHYSILTKYLQNL